MTDNRHAYWKKESECKCSYESLYISNQIDSRTLRIKVINHYGNEDGSDKENDIHESAVVEIPYDDFYEMMEKIAQRQDNR